MARLVLLLVIFQAFKYNRTVKSCIGWKRFISVKDPHPTSPDCWISCLTSSRCQYCVDIPSSWIIYRLGAQCQWQPYSVASGSGSTPVAPVLALMATYTSPEVIPEIIPLADQKSNLVEVLKDNPVLVIDATDRWTSTHYIHSSSGLRPSHRWPSSSFHDKLRFQ